VRVRLALGAAALLVAATACGGPTKEIGVKGTTFVAPPPPAAVTRQATRVARRDALVRRLLQGAPLRVEQSGNWISTTDGRRLGASLVVRLPHPIDVDANLPYVAIPPDSPAGSRCPRPYTRRWTHERAANVPRLVVLVDLRRRTVVEIVPGPKRGAGWWVARPPDSGCNG
jgi:hypothetical protein